MDKATKLLIYGVAAHMLLSMMAMVIDSRKRKWYGRRVGITYGPMEERDMMRLDYLNTKIWMNDTTCVNMLRLSRSSFFRFCTGFRDRGLLEDTIHMCVEEQVAMFLNIVGHNLSRYFNKVLHAIGELRAELIRQPSLDTPSKIVGNPIWDPYFKMWCSVIQYSPSRIFTI
jgi:hypothetical protein